MDKPNIFERHKKIQEINKISENLINDISHSFDEMANDIFKQKNNAIALAFAKDIGKLLRDNGVVASYAIHEYDETEEDAFTKHYGVVFDTIDFSEHDKPFQDEIEKLKSDLSNIKSRCVMSAMNDFNKRNYGALNVVRKADYDALNKVNDELAKENMRLNRELQDAAIGTNLPHEPIEVASMLIGAVETYHTSSLEQALGKGETDTYNRYDVSELRQIAEHLLVYCNNNKNEE